MQLFWHTWNKAKLVVPDFAIGGALLQIVENKLQPLGFFAHKLTQAERAYSDRELLAAYAGIKHFGHMLEARCFLQITNHYQMHSNSAQTNQAVRFYIPIHLRYPPSPYKGSENMTTDMFSWISAIEMPNPIHYEEISKVRVNYPELQSLIDNPQSFKLKLLYQVI